MRIENPDGMQTEEQMIETFLHRNFAGKRTWQGIIGASSKLQEALDEACLADDNDEHVLIVGETGTGKDLLARGIHAGSPMREQELVAVNCGAIPANLIESIFFGHEKGAFTDAKTQEDGLFVAANRGTIYLDELSELPKDLQVKLLRVLDNGEVLPVGATRPVKVSCRVIASTKEDIDEKLETGEFRQDLYFRLAVIRVDLCPLRRRKEDIPLLVDYFLRLSGSTTVFSEEVMDIFMDYSWPGNIRELENAVKRGIVWARNNRVSVIPKECFRYGQLSKVLLKSAAEKHFDLKLTIENLAAYIERGYIKLPDVQGLLIEHTFQEICGRRARETAKMLDVSHNTVYRHLKKVGIK